MKKLHHQPSSSCGHEESDMRLSLRVADVVNRGIGTYTVDTDVVIAVAALYQINFLYCGLH